MLVVGYLLEGGRRRVESEASVFGLSDCERPLLAECQRCGRTESWSCNNHRERLCKPCSKRYQRRLRRIAEYGMEIRPDGFTYMLTLTAPGDAEHLDQSTGLPCQCTPPGGVDLGVWNASHSRRWNHFRTLLRRYCPTLQYIRGVEVQERGALHDHVVVWSPFPLRLRDLRPMFLAAGFGHSAKLQRAQQGSRAFARYISKYITKACDQREIVPWVVEAVDFETGELVRVESDGRYRTWSASRDWGMTMSAVRAVAAAAVRRRNQREHDMMLTLLSDLLGAEPIEPLETWPPPL